MNALKSLDIKKKKFNSENFKHSLLKLKLKAFEPKIRFEIEFKDFIVKTASTPDELSQVIRLRYEVFIKEGLGKTRLFNNDFDRLDLLGDHIMVIHKPSRKVVGTYRLLCSLFTDQFYSESEFDIGDFKKTNGEKLELGRACIHKDFRTGLSITLVWKGLAKYITLSQADFLFGCASVDTVHPFVATALYEQFKKDHFGDDFKIAPKKKYQFGHIFGKISEQALEDYQALVPALLKSYFKAGAKVYSFPALDRDFKCIDFFTILRLSEISPKYISKYF